MSMLGNTQEQQHESAARYNRHGRNAPSADMPGSTVECTVKGTMRDLAAPTCILLIVKNGCRPVGFGCRLLQRSAGRAHLGTAGAQAGWLHAQHNGRRVLLTHQCCPHRWALIGTGRLVGAFCLRQEQAHRSSVQRVCVGVKLVPAAW